MSSLSSRRPDFRLTLGYPLTTVAILQPGGSGAAPNEVEPTEIDLSQPDHIARLRALGVAISRARGRLTVLLPETEVWRGQVRGHPLRAAAAALGAAPSEIAVVFGPRDAQGRLPVAATRHSALAETRAFLRAAALRPVAITGAGAFPGFSAPPRFSGPFHPAAARATLRGFVPARLAWPARLSTVLPGWWPPRGLTLASLPVAAACAAIAVLATLGPRQPATTAPLVAVSEVAPPAAPVVIAVSAPALVAPVPATLSRPPKSRPDGFETQLASAAPALPRALPREAAGSRAGEPIVMMGTRNMPELAAVKLSDVLARGRVAELATGPISRSDALIAPPPSRPGTTAAVAPVTAAVGPAPFARPLARPVAASALTTVAAAPLSGAAALDPPDARPRARPGAATRATAGNRPLSSTITDAVARAVATPAEAAPAPVRLASLADDIPATAALVGGTLAMAAPPEPRPAAARTPAAPTVRAVRPAPVAPTVRVAPATPAKSQVRVTSQQPMRVAPTASGAVVRPQGQRVVAQPTVQRATGQPRNGFAAATTATTAPKAVEKAGLSRGSLSLLGVFGTSGERHALIRMPNGKVQRVRAGDNVQGARVAAVATDSVRLTGSGRDVVLKMK